MESRRVFFVAQLFCLAKTSVKGESIQNHLSNEKKTAPKWLFRVWVGDEKILPSYIANIMNHLRIPINQPV